MRIVWMSWKDIRHPHAGGAEKVSFEIMKRLVRDGHEVSLITSRYHNTKSSDIIEGIQIYRAGNKFTVYICAMIAYFRFFKQRPDIVIDEMNTIPFAAVMYSKTRTILLTYQLARQVWFYQMIFPLSLIGYLVEPIYVRLLARIYKYAITESSSTAKELARYGFNQDHVGVFRVGIEISPLRRLNSKKPTGSILFVGSFRPMKRVLDVVRAFEVAHKYNSNYKLIMAGDNTSAYGSKVLNYIQHSSCRENISVMGRVSTKEKKKLMQQADVLLVTSIKEGWGLIVTEANSQGTPAIAYDVDGLRDSIQNGKTGILTPVSPKSLGQAINTYFESESNKEFRQNAWAWSKEFTFENSYRDFCRLTKID